MRELELMQRHFFFARYALVAAAGVALVATAASADCPPSPRPLCRDLGTTKLSIDAASGRMDWRTTKGPPTSLADFGDPAVTAWSLCAWDDGGLVVDAEVAADPMCDGQSCWSPRGKTGLRLRDPVAAGGITFLDLRGDDGNATKIRARTSVPGGIALPVHGDVTVELLRTGSAICFESLVAASDFRTSDSRTASAKTRLDGDTHVAPLASGGCGASAVYAPGASTPDDIVHDGLDRTFLVHVPASYDGSAAVPVVFLLHGGFGSGSQIENSSRMLEVAEREGFVVVSPDGYLPPGGVRAWNAGTCCGYPSANDVDDVGFVAAVLDRMESSLCVDTRRVYATGMSNGSMLAHRIACDLSDRFRAIANVSGTDMTSSCEPLRAVPELTIHGRADENVPFSGGDGCGAAGVPFVSVPMTLARWLARDGCTGTLSSSSSEGDADCALYSSCAAGTDVGLCVIPDGGHQWPGGVPPSSSGLPGCPFGYQSESFSAAEKIWSFFSMHPLR